MKFIFEFYMNAVHVLLYVYVFKTIQPTLFTFFEKI